MLKNQKLLKNQLFSSISVQFIERHYISLVNLLRGGVMLTG